MASESSSGVMCASELSNQTRNPMSINDNLPSSSPSGKTMLKLLATVLGLVVLVALYYNIIGF
jgi:hypothetical protein